MALRLSAAAPAAAAPTPFADETLAARLRRQANAALAGRDVAAYAALFAEAAAADDVHRRYQARCALLEVGLHEVQGDPALLASAFAIAARKVVEILEEEPREPRLLNLAGVAFYELGELGAAERLFAAAARLDPDLPHVARNLEELTRRRRAGVRGPQLPPPVRAAMRELAPRAKRAAAAGRPAEGLTMSLCMIVKDEEEMLPRCLGAIRDAVDEIIVVDTGSTDRTREIALEFGATLIDHEWTGSFSEARNVSFDAATGDWLLYLDADEVLVEGDGDRLRALAGQTWREAFYLLETNHTGALDDGTAVTHNALRLFRNRPGLRFEGRIHEQIAQHLPGYLPERLCVSDVRIDHYGYLGAVRDAKEKSRRNIELLERQAAEGHDSPFQAFNLGSEYAAAGESARALEQFERAWTRLAGDPHLRTYGFAPSLASRLVRSLRLNGRPADARARGDEVLRTFPGFTDVLLEQAHAASALGDHETAVAELERCMEWGDAPSNYSATHGCGTYLAMASLATLRRERGDRAGAEELLLRCRREHPEFLNAIEPLTRLMLARGEEPEVIVAAVEAGEPLSTTARFMFAAALHEGGAPAAAEEQLRVVLAAQPHAAPAWVALGEALLAQNRLPEAAAAADEVPVDSPWAPAAVQTGLFARLAADEADADDLLAALARAEQAGLHRSELAVFAAWHDARTGGEAVRSLPAEAAELTLTMLEALIRLQAFDAFATLLPVADGLALPRRERRERLARMYLRRGYLESAADEWVAAVEEGGPDVPALAGLAEVAAARGMTEDAELLAREAEALAAS